MIESEGTLDAIAKTWEHDTKYLQTNSCPSWVQDLDSAQHPTWSAFSIEGYDATPGTNTHANMD